MKKLYTIISCLMLILFAGIQGIKAQGIYQLWTGSFAGGSNNSGVLFSTKFDGTGQWVKDVFEVYAPGRAPGNHQEPVVYNNKLYGTMEYGGLNDDGIIYKYDPATNVYQKVADFFTIGVEMPRGSLTLYNNKFYGVTLGAIFEFDPANKSLVKKANLWSLFDGEAAGMLTLYNNKLYGTTNFGGLYDKGVLFEYDPATGNCIKKIDLQWVNGGAREMIAFGNKLYGISQLGGSSADGFIFEYNPATVTVSVVKNMDEIGAGAPVGRPVIYNNKLYGCARWGGANNDGAIYEYDLLTKAFAKKIDLHYSQGYVIYGSLTVCNNKLYGLSYYGGPHSEGMLFEYDPAANDYTPKVQLDSASGFHPRGSLTLCNNKLYGLTSEGGNNAYGVLFEYSPAFNGFAKKIDLGQSIGGAPSGNLYLLNNTLYGVATEGGANGAGTIFGYDLKTQTLSVKYNMDPATGKHVINAIRSRGMTLFNNKFYGVTQAGGLNDKGVIFEFDPATNTYTKKLDFATVGPTLTEVSARLTVFNNKLYGTAGSGGSGDDGVLYEYDPATNNFQVKVNFGGTMGRYGVDPLTVYNNRLYGTTRNGGLYDRGVIYEYNPTINGFTKLYDFDQTTGFAAVNALVPFNNKLYGTTYYGGPENAGVLYEIDPATKQFTKKHEFTVEEGNHAAGGLCVSNNKLYGMTHSGGANDLGMLYEFDPATNTFKNKINFDSYNGRYPGSMEITRAPAPTAHGTPGTCETTDEVIVDASNNTQWIAFTNENGDAVAEINPNGSILGRVIVRYYVHNGGTRKDLKGNFYLNRNITIEVQNQPTRAVNVRLYIRGTEFDALVNTPGSGVFNPEDITVFKNEDGCSGMIQSPAAKLNATVEPWGFDYVYATQVESFSSFYFASSGITALPVTLEYFKGNRQGNDNKLEWKAGCTNDVDFNIERSANGIDFEYIGMVWAAQGNCDKPFTFIDNKVPAGNSFYRLQMKEKNGEMRYSKIILLNHEQATALMAKIIPNPVVNDQAMLQINAAKKAVLQTVISDIMGRTLISKQIKVEEGLNSITLPVQQLKPGVYQLVYYDGEKNQVVRFVKQ